MGGLSKQESESNEIFSSRLISTQDAIELFRNGHPIILVDDEDRENEGDIAIPAQFVTTELVNFMVSEARGLVCVPMTEEWADNLGLPLMTEHGNAPLGTAFTISVEAAAGVTTGISASDRAHTINVLANPQSTSTDFTRPGHIFPLRAKEGGVLVRAGQTEASVDLCRLAGVVPVASICEIMNEDGTMSRMPDLIEFADKHDLKIASVADLIRYRMQTERLIVRKGETILPTPFGEFKAVGFSTGIDLKEHVAMVFGDINPEEPTLVRVHDKCLTGDVFGSLRCDCGEQLQAALRMISDEGSGVVVYMDQEGRGIGLHNKLRAYNLQDDGLDTVEANEALGLPAESRDYGIGAQILVDLGVRKMRLMTNNPIKIKELNTVGMLRGAGLDGFGLQVTERVPIEIEPNEHNVRYLTAKRDKMGHIFESPMPDFG
ncbi:MAG: bifunctional 3,4-dihydroxy-2-butanone-4-phosphate synthase/GTP cyclohydrolase II [Chloroflexi bacterium]|nr:bifunctional 3,4-dihydroxy-2-butanone-4-phosphate synthase/GTP cyclohydrolase II [Chloroflexota bacterium]|tara:strand:- start:5867 stop:7165 length:1299 start_codon:yes stop_codon:yes gene_type:complete